MASLVMEHTKDSIAKMIQATDQFPVADGGTCIAIFYIVNFQISYAKIAI